MGKSVVVSFACPAAALLAVATVETDEDDMVYVPEARLTRTLMTAAPGTALCVRSRCCERHSLGARAHDYSDSEHCGAGTVRSRAVARLRQRYDHCADR